MAMVALLLFGAVVMWLWNAVLPAAVSGIHTIGYWQAVGLLVLSKILFSGFRGGGGGGRKMGSTSRLREKYKRMTEEERQQFKEAWRSRCSTKQ